MLFNNIEYEYVQLCLNVKAIVSDIKKYYSIFQ